jgi:hypothetical protein
MKTTLLLLSLFCYSTFAQAIDKKEDKSDGKNQSTRKDDKKDEKKDEKKEPVRNRFEVTITGAKDAAAEADVKTYLQSIEDVRLEKSEKTTKGIQAVLSTMGKLSRGDLGKAIKDNKDLKVADFKVLRPGREKKEDKKEDKAGDKK